MSDAGGYRDATSLTKWTKIFLWLQVTIAVVAIVSGRLEYELLVAMRDGAFNSQAEMFRAAEASDSRQRLVAMAQFLITAICGVLILCWIYRMNFNARQLGGRTMEFTPGWAVGWYFIPVANLWKPYQAMREIWLVSGPVEDWERDNRPAILPVWWILWLAAGAVGNLAATLLLSAEELGEFVAANWAMLISDVLGMALAIVVLVIVHRVHKMQLQRLNAVPVDSGRSSVGGDDGVIVQPSS